MHRRDFENNIELTILASWAETVCSLELTSIPTLTTLIILGPTIRSSSSGLITNQLWHLNLSNCGSSINFRANSCDRLEYLEG